MAPDTQQNLFYTAKFMLEHNGVVIFYFLALIASIVASIIKPTRSRTLLIVGFALLIFAFEYTKHIQPALLEQTTNSLITERQSGTIARIIHLVLNRAIPYLSPISGFLLVATGIFIEIKNYKKNK